MSDLHYDLRYLPGAPADCLFDKLGLGCCRNTSIPDPTRPLRSAGQWGDFNCDTPLSFLNETFRWIRERIISFGCTHSLWRLGRPSRFFPVIRGKYAGGGGTKRFTSVLVQ